MDEERSLPGIPPFHDASQSNLVPQDVLTDDKTEIGQHVTSVRKAPRISDHRHKSGN